MVESVMVHVARRIAKAKCLTVASGGDGNYGVVINGGANENDIVHG